MAAVRYVPVDPPPISVSVIRELLSPMSTHHEPSPAQRTHELERVKLNELL